MDCPSCGEEITSGGYCWHCGEDLPDELSVLNEEGDESDRDGGGDVEGNERHGAEEPTTPSNGRKRVAAATHLLALFTWAFGPALVFVVTSDEYVKANAANAINWQITYILYMFASVILAVVLVGILTAFLLVFLDIAFCLVAAMKAANGETWKAPYSMDFV